MHAMKGSPSFCPLSADAFPLDEVDGNFVRTVKNCIFSKSIPTPLKGPLRLAAVSKVDVVISP